MRFSRREATELLCQLTPSLSENAIEAAAHRADGWAAGLQMAALAARSARAQRDFEAPMSSGGLLVDDYVWREMLAGEAPELVETLLETAIADRVNASLAQTLTGRPDAGDQLLRAEARGLFVTRLGPEGWFEVHSLARGALLAELARRSPSHLADQHALAAQWYEDAGEVPVALDHWLRAGQPRQALRLLAAHHAELYDTGREATIVRTIAAIPGGVATADVESMLEYAWCHVLVDRHSFLEIVEQATWWAGRSDATPRVRGHLNTLQSIAATMSGRWVEGGALARQAMTHLGDSGWRDPLGRFGWNLVAREVALSERWDDSGDEVRQIDHALSLDPERRLSFEGTRALGEALAGRPVDALRLAAGVRPAASVANMTILRIELAVAEAVAHRELGDRPRAIAELQRLADTPAETMLYCRILASLELAQAHLDDGDLEAASRTFERAEQLVETSSFGPDGRDWLARSGTLLALAAGDIDDARRWSEQVNDPFWGGIAAARVYLAEGNRADALAVLETLMPRCVRHEVVAELLRSRAVDSHDEAMKRSASAVELAVANGILQTVASEGAEVLELVERAAWRAPTAWLDRLRRASTVGRRGSSGGGADPSEPLTERERDVLRFLPSRLTLREIADELHISPNTLKFHLKVIYRKLGVNSRADAADAARLMTNLGRQG